MAQTLSTETAPSKADEANARRREAIATAVFATWAIGGLFLDGWAHIHGKPESLFTPWHGVLYSGVGAGFAWFALEGRRQRAVGIPFEVDRLTLLAGVIFGFGAVGDFGWHEVFGIEDGLEALLSPTHLALMTGGVLFVSGPLRAALGNGDLNGRPSLRRYLPYGICLTLLVSLVSFFTMYVNAFQVELVFNDGEGLQVWGIASVLFTNTLLLGGLLFALRSWTIPFGAATLLFGGVAVLTTGLEAYDQAALIVPALVGGLVADVLIARLAADGPARTAGVRRLGLVVPVVLWLAWFGTYQAVWGVPWSAELWVGAVWLAVLEGFGLTALVFPPQRQVV